MKTAGVSAAWQVTWPAGAPSGAVSTSASLRLSSLSLAWDPETNTAHRWVLQTLGLGDTLWTKGLDHQITWGIVEFEIFWKLTRIISMLRLWKFSRALQNWVCPAPFASQTSSPMSLCRSLVSDCTGLWFLRQATPGCLCTHCSLSVKLSPFPPGACLGPSLPSLCLLWNTIFPVKPSLITFFNFSYCSLLALPPDLFWVMFLHRTNHHDHNIAALTDHLRVSWHAITHTYLA